MMLQTAARVGFLLVSLLPVQPLMAQSFQLGWSISTSQGSSSSSARSQLVRTSALASETLLVNTEQLSTPGVYRVVDPTQPFEVLERSETVETVTNGKTSGFSTFAGFGASVFHSPITP